MPLSRPRALAHLDQARQNHELYQQLKNDGRFLDWAVTVLFYTVLHLIEAYLAEVGTAFDRPRSHQERDRQIVLRLTHIYSQYSLLYTRSQWARYHVDKPKPSAALLQRYEDESFAHIVAELAKLGVDLHP